MGGYVLIDLKDVNITVNGSAVKIEGAYEAIEGNNRKATMITRLTLDNIECSDRWVNFRPLPTGYVGLIGFNSDYLHLMLEVNSDDMVKVFEE